MSPQDHCPPSTHDQRSLEEILAQPCPRPTFPEQNVDGIDLSLIRRNLQLSILERVRQSDQARWQAEQLGKHARRIQP